MPRDLPVWRPDAPRVGNDVLAVRQGCGVNAPERFRKKPIAVEAIQWTGDNNAAVLAFVQPGTDDLGTAPFDPFAAGADLWVAANECWVDIKPGSWIIRDASGCYPCLPERFADAYEPIEEQA